MVKRRRKSTIILHAIRSPVQHSVQFYANWSGTSVRFRARKARYYRAHAHSAPGDPRDTPGKGFGRHRADGHRQDVRLWSPHAPEHGARKREGAHHCPHARACAADRGSTCSSCFTLPHRYRGLHRRSLHASAAPDAQEQPTDTGRDTRSPQ